MPEESSTELATIQAAEKLRTELAQSIPAKEQVIQAVRIAIPALIVATGGQELIPDLGQRGEKAIAACLEYTKPPTNDDEQNDILAVQRVAQKLRTELVKQGDAYKAQLNGPKDAIHEIVKQAEAALKKAELHCQGLNNAYQKKLQDARDAEKLRFERERQEIERQRQQAQREQEEAERKRQQAEIARQQAEAANSPEAKAKAQQEEQRLKDEAAKLEADAYEKDLAVAMAPTPAAMPSAPAPQARVIFEFSFVGRNDAEKAQSLERFHAAHKEFFSHRIVEEGAREYSIKLKIKDLNDAINGVAPFQKLTAAPGLVIHERLSTLR